MGNLVKVTLLVKDDLLADEVRRRAEEAFRVAYELEPLLDTPSGTDGYSLVEVVLDEADNTVIAQADAWLTAHGFTPDVQVTEFPQSKV